MDRRLLSVRIACGVVFVVGIAGMIIASLSGNNEGWVITSGAATALAAIVLMTASAVADRSRIEEFDDVVARRIEGRIAALVEAGANEAEVRELVRDSLRLRGGRIRS
jgi:hypothetical protein